MLLWMMTGSSLLTLSLILELQFLIFSLSEFIWAALKSFPVVLLSDWLAASLGCGTITISTCSLAIVSAGMATDSSGLLPLERRFSAFWVQENERCRGAGWGDRKWGVAARVRYWIISLSSSSASDVTSGRVLIGRDGRPRILGLTNAVADWLGAGLQFWGEEHCILPICQSLLRTKHEITLVKLQKVFEGPSAELTYVGGGVDIPLWLMTPENEELLPGRHGGEATQGE